MCSIMNPDPALPMSYNAKLPSPANHHEPRSVNLRLLANLLHRRRNLRGAASSIMSYQVSNLVWWPLVQLIKHKLSQSSVEPARQ
jgi:hypothetical protein